MVLAPLGFRASFEVIVRSITRETLPEETKDKIFETTSFYVPPDAFDGGKAVFPADEERHILNTLRLRHGVRVRVLDGCGGVFTVLLDKKVAGMPLEGSILNAERTERVLPRLSAAIGMGRKERMKTAAEKLAELGCHRITPLLTERVQVPGDPMKQVSRLGRVCLSALKQSRSLFLTQVEQPVFLDDFLQEISQKKSQLVFCRRGLPEGKAASFRLQACHEEYVLLVGPEGGFSAGEISRIDNAASAWMHLGSNELRFETAAIAGFVILRKAVWGDLILY